MKEIIPERIEKLRREMKNSGVDAYYISGTDPHQSEYLPEYWQTRSFISGFTGSAGLVVITQEKAALWTDSRYFLQAGSQLEGTGIQLMKMRTEGTPEPGEWLGSILPTGSMVGTDAKCMSLNQYKNFKLLLNKKKLQLKNAGDLLSVFWTDRPPLPGIPVFEHELRYAGFSRLEKIGQIRKKMEEADATTTIISALDDLAWTFNLRGEDVESNPVFVAYSIITNKEVSLYLNPGKVPPEIKKKLKEENIQLKTYDAIFEDLGKITGTVLVDPDRTNQALIESLPAEAELMEQVSVPAMLKAVKSAVELSHIRETMKKDGIAMVDFLFWLDRNIGKIPVTEYDAAMKLTYFRSKQEGYKGISFFPIIGYNETGAIVHRHVTKETAHEIKKEGMLLFDSGGQYITGTTDITRTVILSGPTNQQKKDFTIVLKGMIGLTTASFPAGTKGCNLDILARKAMWDHGMNYGHGTCHGIGYFLNVHEGPMSIRQEYNEHPISPGMVLSNEPGFYREGQYGLRTENMMVCVEREKTEFGKFYGFETLTLCPIDLNLIEKSLLTQNEISWIDNYHQWCYEELSPLLENEEKRQFLKKKTMKLD